MWINPIIATAIVTAGFGVQAWILITVVGLKVDVCRIKERLGINCIIVKNKKLRKPRGII